MNIKTIPAPWLIAGGVIAAGLAWAVIRPKRPDDTGNAAIDVSRDAVGAVTKLASGIIGGIVQGAAAVVGVPTTGQDVCCNAIDGYDKASKAGSTWGKIVASFDVSARCPALDYLKWAAGMGRPEHCPKKGVVTWEMESGEVVKDEPPGLFFDPFAAITRELH